MEGAINQDPWPQRTDSKQKSIRSCQVLARGKAVPEVRRAAFKDALYRDEN